MTIAVSSRGGRGEQALSGGLAGGSRAGALLAPPTYAWRLSMEAEVASRMLERLDFVKSRRAAFSTPAAGPGATPERSGHATAGSAVIALDFHCRCARPGLLEACVGARLGRCARTWRAAVAGRTIELASSNMGAALAERAARGIPGSAARARARGAADRSAR